MQSASYLSGFAMPYEPFLCDAEMSLYVKSVLSAFLSSPRLVLDINLKSYNAEIEERWPSLWELITHLALWPQMLPPRNNVPLFD